jgi:transcriptional regulator with XRE-family HTH domain
MRERRARLAERRKVLGLTQEALAEALLVERTTVARWEAGANTPGLWARRRLADVLHVPLDHVEDLLVPGLISPLKPDGVMIVTSGSPTWEDADGLRALATTAAQSSSAFTDLFSSSNVSDDVLEHFGLALSRIATAYVHAPLLPLFTELVTVRDNLFALLHGRQSPQQSRDLFLLAGTACLLLAHASQNLGETASSMAQIRAAQLCAERAGHTGLRAWTAGTGALIAEWSPQSRMSLKLAQHAASLAPPGEARIRIAAIEARTAARIGDHVLARRALDRMQDARQETPVHDEVEQFGGLLTFPAAKQDYYLGGTYTLLGDHEAAHHHATAAITAYRDGPPEERSYGDEALAHIDLITIGILEGAFDDDAEGALRHVLDLPADLRIRQLGNAMNRVSALTRNAEHQGNRTIGQLSHLIRNYQVIDGAATTPVLR